MDAETWKAYHESEKAYYLNPTVEWFDEDVTAGLGLPAPGYYVLHSCGEPACCQPAGPFQTTEEAREYSRVHLVAREDERAKRHA
jgi:hypothetical protein